MTTEGGVHYKGVQQNMVCANANAWRVSEQGFKVRVRDFNPVPDSVPGIVPPSYGAEVKVEVYGAKIDIGGDFVGAQVRRFGGKMVAHVRLARNGFVYMSANHKGNPWNANFINKDN